MIIYFSDLPSLSNSFENILQFQLANSDLDKATKFELSLLIIPSLKGSFENFIKKEILLEENLQGMAFVKRMCIPKNMKKICNHINRLKWEEDFDSHNSSNFNSSNIYKAIEFVKNILIDNLKQDNE